MFLVIDNQDGVMFKCSHLSFGCIGTILVKTYESKSPSSHNLDKVTVSFDKLINTDIFLHCNCFILQAVVHNIN